jgi:hypothetical protein
VSVQDQVSAVSHVVREGGLDDEELDFDNETGCSIVDEGTGDDAEAVREEKDNNEEPNED